MERQKLVTRLLSYKVSFTLIVFVALLVIFQIFTPGHTFFQRANLFALARLAPDLGIVALGVGMLMICGEFDLSIASTIPMSAFVFVTLLGAGFPLWLNLILTLCVGILVGLGNGLLVTRTRLPSFILTLGTMLFWKGLLYTSSKMMPIGIRAWLPPGSWLENMFVGIIGGSFPVSAFWFAGFAVLLALILHFTKLGNWIFVTGDNETAARAMGINTNRVKTIAFMGVGFLSSVVGLMQCLRIESFSVDLMEALEVSQGKKISLEILREGQPLGVEVTPAKRPPDLVRKMLHLPLENLPDAAWHDLPGLLERLPPGEAAKALRFRLMRPGVLLPPGAREPNPLPDNLTIAITKQGSQPAKVVVGRGDKKWEATEDTLDKLPADVRPHVERMLGRYTVGFGQPDTWDMIPDLGPAPVPGRPHRPADLQKQLDQMHRQLEDLRKTLDELKAAPPAEKAPPPPIEPPENQPEKPQ